MNTRIKNIQEQEITFNKTTALLNDLEEIINQLKSLQPDFKKLMEYYGSSQWMEDMEDSNKGAFEDLKCGVLSQDAVYDLYTQQRALQLKTMRIALDYLEIK